MKKSLVMLAVLCCAAFAMATELENLIKEPMTITNPATTVMENGVYTITNANDKTKSVLRYKVVFDKADVDAVTFAVEGKAMENVGQHGCYFGMILDLLHTDNTWTYGVNFGMGKDTFDWCLRYRPFKSKKPIKEIVVSVQYTKAQGKVAFRNPQLYLGLQDLNKK